MSMVCQQEVLKELKEAAQVRRQSILISGIRGCGKTYLAKTYAELLGVGRIYRVDPIVSDIRSTIQSCIDLKQDTVICIENLDEGTKAASYALLKFIEEPSKYVYIVVTCRNRYHIPDTILSRCYCFECLAPTKNDIEDYVIQKYPDKYGNMKHSKLWTCLSTFYDCDMLSNLSRISSEYIVSLKDLKFSNTYVSDISWRMSHYPEASKEDPNITYFALKYILATTTSDIVKQCCVDCLDELSDKRISSNMVLSKFAFEMKYAV